MFTLQEHAQKFKSVPPQFCVYFPFQTLYELLNFDMFHLLSLLASIICSEVFHDNCKYLISILNISDYDPFLHADYMKFIDDTFSHILAFIHIR